MSVYTPPDGAKTRGLPVLFDGEDMTRVPTPAILDHLIAAKRIPPMIAVFIGNAPGARPVELPCNPKFAQFVHDEVLPWVRRTCGGSDAADRTVIAGSSYGGLAATFIALVPADVR